MVMIKNLGFIGLWLVAACATAAPESQPDTICAAEKVGWFTLAERPATSPDFSGVTSLERSQVQSLAASLPAQEKARIVAITRHLFPALPSAWTPDRLRALHEDVFKAFESRAGNVYGAAHCGKRETIGAYLYSYVLDGVMRSYQGADVVKPPVGQQPGGRFDASSIVMTALVLELNTVPYDFPMLSAAMAD